MNYVLCPKCQKVQPAFFNPARHIVCAECKTESKVKQFCCKQCPDCGSLLYAPPAALERSEFPCAKEHLRRKEALKEMEERNKREAEETASPDAPIQEQPVPTAETEAPFTPPQEVPCPAEETLPFPGVNLEEPLSFPGVNLEESSPFPGVNLEESVPFPGINPEEPALVPGVSLHEPLPIPEETLKAPAACENNPARADAPVRPDPPVGPGDPIPFKWNFSPLELLHVAESSDAIPPHSLLIVGDQQEAYYFAGGARQCFDEEGTYPLFDDTRTEEEIIKGIYLGNTCEDSLAYKLNTRIIFFDKHQQQLSFHADFSLPGSPWRVSLPIDLTFQICETENLLRNQKDFESGSAAKELIRQIQTEVKQELSERLLCLPPDKLAETDTEESLRGLLFDVLNRETEAVRQSANRLLTQRFGLRIDYFRPQPVNAVFFNTAAAEKIVCPKCGKELWTAKGNRGRIQCHACGAQLRWCFMCGRITESILTDGGKEKCADPLCGYLKIR